MLRKDIAVDAIEIESVSASQAARDLPGLATIVNRRLAPVPQL